MGTHQFIEYLEDELSEEQKEAHRKGFNKRQENRNKKYAEVEREQRWTKANDDFEYGV